MQNKGKLENNTTLYFTAPILLQFVMWVIRTALKDEVKHLYFLARDGYFMYEYANAICHKYSIPIQCHYLYCSRYAFRIPAYHLNMKQALEHICLGGHKVTFESVLRRAGIQEEKYAEMSKEFKLQLHKKMSYKELKQLKITLKNNKKFRNNVVTNSRKAYQNCINFLNQEGLFTSQKLALVDSGWTGSMQQTLRKLLESSGYYSDMTGYYFGMYEVPYQCQKEYKTYFFKHTGNIQRKINFNNCLFETIFSAPHGMTIGYKKINHKYAPILNRKESLNELFLKQETRDLKQFLLEALKEDMLENLFLCIDPKITYELCNRFMVKPSKKEARIYGNLCFCDDVVENHHVPLAKNLKLDDFCDYTIFNRLHVVLKGKDEVDDMPIWLEGSITNLNKRLYKQFQRQFYLYKWLLYMKKEFQS